jgi:hypothetical protein
MRWSLARTLKVNGIHLPARAFPDTSTKRLGSIASIIDYLNIALAIALILTFLAALGYLFVLAISLPAS